MLPELRISDPDVSSGCAAYVHIPFCSARCGYCDFNTYTNLTMGDGVCADSFEQTLIKEIRHSAHVLHLGSDGRDKGSDAVHQRSPRPKKPLLHSIFFGGGTPSLLTPAQLGAIVDELTRTWGLCPGAEVSMEANPESMTAEKMRSLKEIGINRLSFGMQSADPHVLHILQRRHTPGQVQKVAQAAQELDLEYSLDLIYGTPGESLQSWQRSLEAAISLKPQHISAYALTLEPHVPMSRRIARGELPDIDPDDEADKYEIAERVLSDAGYQWYEISNWALPGHECRHNITYWKEGNWWGYGPGAHSHINGTRWWNLRHPRDYAQALCGHHASHSSDHTPDNLPIDGYEILTPAQIREERIMMGIRLREGLHMRSVDVDTSTVHDLVNQGLLCAEPLREADPKLVLSMRGRLLADTVIRALW